MNVTEENIGDIICRHDTGERFQVADITEVGISILTEDGVEDHIASHSVSGEVVHDNEQINSFQQNRRLGQSLLAAGQASQRRLTSNLPDSLAEEASRISRIVQAQHQAFLDRLQTECRARQTEHTHSFDDKLNSAKARSTRQGQEYSAQTKDLNR